MRTASLAALVIAPMVFACAFAPSIQAAPAKVTVGAYLNDIQQPDFKANSYAIDLYIWFRWWDPNIDPSKTLEFRNRDASDNSNLLEALYEKPETMPDGSLYSIIRYRGQFSTKFRLDSYPFDTQVLKVVLEDTILDVDELVYVPETFPSVIHDPGITLPGFTVGKPSMLIVENIYPTNFGDLSEAHQETFSRVTLSIPVTRPAVSMSIKLFLPIVLVVVCAALVFFIRPKEIGARIGLGITGLLTLVALELSSSAVLPDIDYLMMLDKVFIFPCAVSTFIDIRSGYRDATPRSAYARLFHKKRLIVANGRIRTKHIMFSSNPVVGAKTSIFNKAARLGCFEAPFLLWPLHRECIARDLAYWQQGEEHSVLMLKACDTLGLQFAALDYSTMSDGTLVFWEANPMFGLPKLRKIMLPRRRRAAERVLSYHEAIGMFLDELLMEPRAAPAGADRSLQAGAG
ncbi:MAG: hypothetical protein ACRECM_01405 [Methyloceanibacter sp.]